MHHETQQHAHTTMSKYQSDRRPVSRRSFLAMAAAGLATASLLAAACGPKEQIVYVTPPTATPLPPATPKPAVEAEPTLLPAPAQRQGPIQLPVPARSGPVAAASAQSQVIPELKMRNRPYTNRLQPPERLMIPAIELDSKVIPVGTKTDPQGRVLWETAAFAVGHHRGSGMPGEKGNIVLSGHISSPHEGAVFRDLPHLKPGLGIIIATLDRQYLYTIVDTLVVTPDAVEVLDPTDKSIVTMITCVPDGVYSHRLIVRAEAVG
jgi:LPXTG-site transpeptidase (sortase) family protein